MPKKISFDIQSITVSTNGFDHLTYDNADTKATRLLELPFVHAVDSTHGIIEMHCELSEYEACIKVLQKHLTARIAKGEKVRRGEWYQGFTPGGSTPIHYIPGEYPTEDFRKSQ